MISVFSQRNYLTLLTLCILLAACQSAPPLSQSRRVETSEEIANVFVSAYPAVPWNDIVGTLEPKHNLSTADAQSMAAIATQSQASQFMSSFATGLGLGFPGKSSTSSATVAANGDATTSSTKTVTGGVAPTTGNAPTAVAIDNTSLAPTLAKVALAGGVDATTQLMVGTGVYQLAGILDNQLSKAVKLKNYQANLITFQINMQPLSRNLPYDAYVNLTLMPGTLDKAVKSSPRSNTIDTLPPIIIYPLVIADAMESSNIGRNNEVIRQAALSLSGVVNNIGASAGANGGSDKLDEIVGSDRNSLVTVGRIADNSLRIRLGAELQGSSRLAMVPRTQNISLVVFTKTYEENNKPDENTELIIDKLVAVTEVSFFDSETGKYIPSKQGDVEGYVTRREDILKVIRRNGFGVVDNFQCTTEDLSVNLLRELERGNYGFLTDCLRLRNEADYTNVARFKGKISNFFDTKSHENLNSARQYSITCVMENMVNCKELKDTINDPLAPLKQDIYKDQENKFNTSDLKNFKIPTLTTVDELKFRVLVAELMTLQTSNRHAKLIISLQDKKDINTLLPLENQTIFLNDDGKEMKATLRGGKKIIASNTHAAICVSLTNNACIGGYSQLLTPNSSKATIFPMSIEVDSNDNITLVFSSLIANELFPSSKPTEGKIYKHFDTNGKIQLFLWSGNNLTTENNIISPKNIFNDFVLNYAPDAAPKIAEAPISATSDFLTPSQDGTVTASINIGAWDTSDVKDKKINRSIKITGAVVKNVTPNLPINTNTFSYPVTPNSIVVFNLYNYSTSKPIQVQAYNDTTAKGSPITFTVQSSQVSNK